MVEVLHYGALDRQVEACRLTLADAYRSDLPLICRLARLLLWLYRPVYRSNHLFDILQALLKDKTCSDSEKHSTLFRVNPSSVAVHADNHELLRHVLLPPLPHAITQYVGQWLLLWPHSLFCAHCDGYCLA